MRNLVAIGIICVVVWIALIISNNHWNGWCHMVGGLGIVALILAKCTYYENNHINTTRYQTRRP